MTSTVKDKLAQVLLQNSALDLYKNILHDYRMEDIFSLARQSEHPQLAFRATWTLEHILLNQLALLKQYKAEVIELYISSDNASSLRSSSKLIMTMLQRKDEISAEEEEILLHKTFQLIERNNCPVALLVNCWDILYLFCKNQPWIADELRMHISFHLEQNATPASLSRGNRILKKLERITNS